MATVKSIEVCHKRIAESPETVCAIYEYHHVISSEKLYSIEHHYNKGSTLRSSYVINPICIWTPDTGWMPGMEPTVPVQSSVVPDYETAPEQPTIKLTLELESSEDAERLRQLFMEGKLKELGVMDVYLKEEEDICSDDTLGDDQ